MARFLADDADKYGGNGGGGSFFKLENDKDVARVQLLGNDMNDFPGYSVHEIEVNDKKRYVNCLREYNDPVEVCPFCAAKKKLVAKLFIPLYNIDEDEIQVWERGKKFFATLSSYCARNPEVVSVVTEIERNGKPKSTDTTYMLYATKDVPERDKLEDFADEMPEILGRYVLDKTADDMEYFLDEGEFPDEDSNDEDEAPRRRESSRRERDEEPRRRPSRRGREED